MPTRANLGCKSPLECLNGRPVGIVGVVVFKSPCKVYQVPKNKAIFKRSTSGVIIGKNEEANEQLKRALVADSEDELEQLARSREQYRQQEESALRAGTHGDSTSKQDMPSRSLEVSRIVGQESATPLPESIVERDVGLRRSDRKRTPPLEQREADEDQASASACNPPSVPSTTMRWKEAAPVAASAMKTIAMSALGLGRRSTMNHQIPNPTKHCSRHVKA